MRSAVSMASAARALREVTHPSACSIINWQWFCGRSARGWASQSARRRWSPGVDATSWRTVDSNRVSPCWWRKSHGGINSLANDLYILPIAGGQARASQGWYLAMLASAVKSKLIPRTTCAPF